MLEIRGVTKTYADGTRALIDINLSVGKGMFGLLGPNGAGKSTLMRTLATLQQPDSGELLFDRTDVLKNPVTIRRQLGYLPQDFGVYPNISAEKLLHHLAILKGVLNRRERSQQVQALLQLTNLSPSANKKVATFSGGMRQRFGIAQALLGNPRLIIVDEPTAGLDPEERNRFYNLLSEIGENIVVILSTHIVDDVRELCPNMAILAKGRVVLHGKPLELIRELEGKIWSRSVARSLVPELRATHQVIAVRMFAGETKLYVLSDGNPGNGFEPVKPDLEHVYLVAITDSGS